jgi:hypothetical protein
LHSAPNFRAPVRQKVRRREFLPPPYDLRFGFTGQFTRKRKVESTGRKPTATSPTGRNNQGRRETGRGTDLLVLRRVGFAWHGLIGQNINHLIYLCL